MRFAPYDQLNNEPSIIVDGYGAEGTEIVLSHWPGSGTPAELADDLSTQIAFRYLDSPEFHVNAELVSNNHFDEDGLCGIFAILHPEQAQSIRDRLIDIASAGDFATWKDRDSARIAMTLMAYADESTTPLDLNVSYPKQTALLYESLLELLPGMIEDIYPYEKLWAAEDARLQANLDALGSGDITIRERPEIDLAIVRPGHDETHDMAIFNATQRLRILTLSEGSPSLRYRYESWVMFQSRPVMPRVDLHPLASILSEKDSVPWESGDLDDLTPALRPTGESSLGLDEIERIVTEYL
ncbi:MAG: DUF6687 family protein [Actinomycetota bacterium]